MIFNNEDRFILDEVTVFTNYTKQYAVILNILRTCEAAIDMAMRIVRLRQLAVSQTSREVFQLYRAKQNN